MKQKQRKHLNGPRKPSSRVFSLVLDKASFIHKIALSVDGKLKQNFEQEFQHPETLGIYTPESLYSRFVSGKFWPTGNSADLVYGRTKHFPNLSSLRITMRSEKRPVTAAEAILLIEKLTVGSPQTRVSNLEFTYDVTGISIEYVLRHIIHRARTPLRVLFDGQRKTIYVGSPRSAWQVRIYEKTETVLRLEFILRRSFLSRVGIQRPEDLLLLRKLDVWKLMSLRRVSAHKPAVLRRTHLQRKLEAMQRRFIW